MPNWCTTCKANGEYWPATEAVESRGRYYPLCGPHIKMLEVRRRIDALTRYVAVEVVAINQKVSELNSEVRGG